MSGEHMEFNSGNLEGGGKASQQSTEDQTSPGKEASGEETGNGDKESQLETNSASGESTAPPETQSAPVKRSHSVEDEDEGRKKRRKDDSSRGKSGSNSGGSPKSALGVESEGEEAKSVESPGPKVPPLKIVISGGSLEEPGSGGRNGKAGSGRHHLPYVVATSTESEGASPPAAAEESDRGGSAGSGEETTPGQAGTTGGSSTRGAHQRVLRSHRVKKTSESCRSSKENSSVANTAGSGGSSPVGAEGGSPRQVSPTPVASETAPETEEKPGSGTPAATATVSSTPASNPVVEEQPPPPPPPQPTPQELHPRKRKIRPKDSQSSANNGSSNSTGNTPSSGSNNTSNNLTSGVDSNSSTNETVTIHPDQISNSYQLFLNIRKQIERKRKGLFPVQPKPPQGFKDYLMNRCTYVLANNANSRVPPPMASPPASLPQGIRDLFIAQEKDRHRLLMQHVIEKEKLVLSVEQEILRVHGRAARALANQSLPFSACTILRDEEVYSAITPEQEEKDRNARSRYNGRLFLSWLQDVDDKWEKIKEAMLLRHHNEAESLHAVQKMDWEWKMKEIGICELKAAPVIDETHVPMVHVSDDFDLLPA